LQNKTDLEQFLLLLVIGAATLAVGAPADEKKELTGSEVSLVPALQIGSLPSLCVGGHQGGGHAMEKGWSSFEGRFQLSSLSSLLDGGRWRLLDLSSFSGHGDGGRRPAFPSSPMNLLAEWRPYFFLPAAMPTGRQCCVRMVAMASSYGNFVAPSGLVPRRRRGASRSSAKDLIAFLVLSRRSFLQKFGTCLYFLSFPGSVCKMYCHPE
jgi:hypothetical protein